VKVWERWSFGILSAIVAVTGFAYLWMKYFVTTDDPMAVVNHPWQPAMLNLHVIASPAVILVFGIILNSHVLRKLSNNRLPNRRTGLASFGTFAAMVITGYSLQVVTSEALLQVMMIVHVASGVVFSASYIAHLLISLRITRPRSWQQVREVA
jgi:hypothetical protein